MQLTLAPKTLADIHAALRNIPSRKNGIPVCGMFLVEAADGRARVTATDGDIEASVEVDAGGQCDGIAVAPHLIEATGKLPAAEVTIDIDEQRAVARAGRARFAAQVLPGGDFPRMAPAFDTAAQVEAAALVNLFEATRGAAAEESETRYYLWGVHLETAEGRLHAVATDGHRLHAASLPCPAGLDIPADANVIVPAKTVVEIVRLAGKAETGSVRVEIGRGAIAVTSAAGERVTSKLIDGAFPDWRRVMGKPSGVTVTVDAAELAGAIERVIKAQAADTAELKIETGNAVRLIEDGEHMRVEAARMTGEAVDAIAAEFSGKWGERGVSGKLLRTALAALVERGADTVVIDTDKVATPLRVEAPADEDFTAIVMPMRI